MCDITPPSIRSLVVRAYNAALECALVSSSTGLPPLE